MTDTQTIFEEVFFPHMTREIARARTPGFRFAHYTSAEGGLKILGSGKMLLRNSVLMNDYSEVNHGLNCLSYAWGGPLGDRLKAILKQVQADLPEIIEANFNEQFLDVKAETYLLSVSEHGSHDPDETAHEDRYGRLSMWRAYAPKNGIAFILRNTPFVVESNALQAFTSPVLYVEPEAFLPYFEEIVIGATQIVRCDFAACDAAEFCHRVSGAYDMARGCPGREHKRVSFDPMSRRQQSRRLSREGHCHGMPVLWIR